MLNVLPATHQSCLATNQRFWCPFYRTLSNIEVSFGSLNQGSIRNMSSLQVQCAIIILL